MGRTLERWVIAPLIVGWFIAAFLYSGEPRNPLLRTKVTRAASGTTKGSASKASTSETPAEPAFGAHGPMAPSAELLGSIQSYVDTPKGGIDWQLFGRTQQKPYSYLDDEGIEWVGVRPKFPDKLRKLDGKEVLVKGYMFPLGQQEKQPLFLLGPFPVACPFHYDVTPNLIIEVHAEKPLAFSYDAISMKGKLELVPHDDEYNVFYRLKKAKRVR